MRILSIRLGSYSCTGGIERACRDSDRILATAGMHVTVVSLWDLPADMPPVNERERYWGCRRNKGALLWRVLICLLTERWDVVWIQHRLLTPLAGLVRLLSRARLMVWIYGLEVWSPPSAYWRYWLHRADRILAISAFTAEKCAKLYRIPRNRIRVCPLGVSDAMLTPGAPADAPAVRPPYVLAVSRLAWPDAAQKGILRVCEAMRHVVRHVPEASCVIAGDGAGRRVIEEQVAALGLKDRIAFAGRLSDAALRATYAGAKVFALPSTVEGFGLVYAEAMAQRLPVVAGRSDAAIDIVVDGHTGFLVDPLDVEAVGRALVTLLKDETLRAKMGQSGYERVQMEFTQQAMSRRLLAALSELTS